MAQFTQPSQEGNVPHIFNTNAEYDSKFSWLNWWYRLSCPTRPGENAPFEQQDIYRRARLASKLLFLMLAIMLSSILISLLAGNFGPIAVTGIVTLFLFLAIFLNRTGLLVIEGLLIVSLWTIGVLLSFLLQPRMTIDNLIQYDLFAIAILLTVTFLPPWSVFIVTVFNCIFIWLSLTYLPHDHQLTLLLQTEGAGKIIMRPISLNIVVMVITYLWARSNYSALKRADRAELIAKLQYDLAERERALATHQQQIDYSVRQIINTLIAYANGNTKVRVPLSSENILWNIAGTINNLLGRVQHTRHTEIEPERLQTLNFYIQQLEQENAALRTELAKERTNHPPDTNWRAYNK